MLAAVRRPPADWDVDAALVRRLLAEQAPEHAPARAGDVRWIASGWDNEIFRVGDRALARIPRRGVAVPLVENEHRWLPDFPELPLPIPRPLVRGRPSETFPHPWSLCPWVEGAPVTGTELADPPAAAELLGRFLRALHREAPADAPHNPFRGIPLRDREDRLEPALDALGIAVDAAAVRATWAAVRDLEPTGPRVWLHGDLHPSNVLASRGELTGVIDFGDLCAGDLATDLALGWMLFDAPEREAFFHAAGADAPARERSRGWALALALVYAATAEQDPAFRAMALATVERCTGHR